MLIEKASLFKIFRALKFITSNKKTIPNLRESSAGKDKKWPTKVWSTRHPEGSLGKICFRYESMWDTRRAKS